MISVTEPIGAAFDWTKQVLFHTFRFRKWAVLGFCAFLANLGGGSGNYRFNGNPFGRAATQDSEVFTRIGTWISTHLALVIGLGALLLLLLVAIGLVLAWLSSRGQFMFLDGVIHDRAEVADPWKRFREHGNSLFVFQILVGLGAFAIFAVVGLSGWLIARPDIAARDFGSRALIALIAGGGLLFASLLVLIVVTLLVKDFVVPIMYRRGLSATQAFAVLRWEILPGHGGSFVLFYLMKLVLSLAAAVVILLGTCLTCCLAGLPYVSSVVFLPVFVFFRAYSLFFFAQFGEEWRMIGAVEPEALAPAEG